MQARCAIRPQRVWKRRPQLELLEDRRLPSLAYPLRTAPTSPPAASSTYTLESPPDVDLSTTQAHTQPGWDVVREEGDAAAVSDKQHPDAASTDFQRKLHGQGNDKPEKKKQESDEQQRRDGEDSTPPTPGLVRDDQFFEDGEADHRGERLSRDDSESSGKVHSLLSPSAGSDSKGDKNVPIDVDETSNAVTAKAAEEAATRTSDNDSAPRGSQHKGQENADLITKPASQESVGPEEDRPSNFIVVSLENNIEGSDRTTSDTIGRIQTADGSSPESDTSDKDSTTQKDSTRGVGLVETIGLTQPGARQGRYQELDAADHAAPRLEAQQARIEIRARQPESISAASATPAVAELGTPDAQSEDVLTQFTPFDPAVLSTAVSQLVNQVDDLGAQLAAWLTQGNISSYVAAAAAVAGFYEVRRRRLQSADGETRGSITGPAPFWIPRLGGALDGV